MKFPSSAWVKSSLVCCGLATLSFTGNYYPETDVTTKEQATSNSSNKALQIPDFRQVAKKAVPAVVSIKVQTKKVSSYFGHDNQGEDPLDFFGNNFWKYFNLPNQEKRSQVLSGQASGVIVSPEGYILTNNHVVKDMDNINVQLKDGREFPAKVLGQDTNSDLALIKVEAKDLPYLDFGNSNDLEVGQWVAAVGNPFGLQATLTVGVVSAKDRNNLDIVPYEDFIQTDTAINAGNSGGPLIDLDGKIVGINTAIATNSSAGYMGIGFSIPSNMARFFMDEILKNGKVRRGYLGVTLQSIDYNLAQAFDLQKIEGTLVTSVQKNSPAERAGIKTEDIILKYNDRPVEGSASLRNAIYMMPPGTKVILTVLRNGRTIQIPVVVEQMVDQEKHETVAVQKTQLGIEVEDLTPELAHSLGYTDEKGVVVTKVEPGSAIGVTGLKKGAIILSVNRKKIENKKEFYDALKETPKGKPVLLQVKQGEVHAFISVFLE